jgi:ABC-type multidrug transport system ATPase subunit
MTTEDAPAESTTGGTTADGSTGDEPAAGDAAVETPGETPVLEASDLSVSFGDLTVFSDVSVTVAPGTVTALVGPNGSGKTTLLRVLAGLLGPDEGTVTLRATGDRPVGYLPQSPGFRSGFTVRETLAFYGDLAAETVDPGERLSQVGLGSVADRPVEALSGGMTRLLGVAQALVGDPAVLVLDEPTSGLDPGMSRRVFEAVASARSSGVAVVLATHDLPAVERAADSVVLVDRGRVLARGPPASLLAEVETDTLEDAFVSLVDREEAAVRAGGDAP